MEASTNGALALATADELGGLTIETIDGVLLLGLDRPAKRNALTQPMLSALANAYARYEADSELRCAVLYGHGQSFCVGADLLQIKDNIGRSDAAAADGEFDPLQISGPTLSKPVVAAVHGMCLAGGMELALAGDIIIAAEGTKLGQPETARALFAFGGGVVRWPVRVGWGNAQRYLLTGDLIDAEEALRIGLIQEVVPADKLGDRALALAKSIAAAGPLGVRDTLAVGRLAFFDGPAKAFEEQAVRREAIIQTADAAEGIASFIERRAGRYIGA